MRLPYVWVALAVAPCVGACAGLLVRRDPGAPTAAREALPDGSSELAPETSVAAVGRDSGTPSDDGDCAANARETRHRVAFMMIGPDVARLTTTRDFEARESSKPMCLRPDVSLPAQSVVESFEIQTDGAWRKGLLGPQPGPDDRAPSPSSAPQDRPWASFGTGGGSYLQTPAFRPRGPIQIRYTLWAQGELRRGGRRWVYCDSDNEGTVVPEVVVAPDVPGLVVRPDAESKWCVDIEKAEPPRTQLSARFGAYRVQDGWWWRLELSAPESLTKGPALPDDAPVVFVLDASRSMQGRGGLGPQLAIARAYLANTPHADVELILTNRSAERLFGHFVPVAELETALARRLPGVALKNGSFLDRGAELAADVLASEGRPGRVILMTDGELRSRFDQSAAVTTLKHAPPRTSFIRWTPASGPERATRCIISSPKDWTNSLPILAERLMGWTSTPTRAPGSPPCSRDWSRRTESNPLR